MPNSELVPEEIKVVFHHESLCFEHPFVVIILSLINLTDGGFELLVHYMVDIAVKVLVNVEAINDFCSYSVHNLTQISLISNKWSSRAFRNFLVCIVEGEILDSFVQNPG